MRILTLASLSMTTLAAAQPLTPVPFEDVTLTGDFWGPRLEAVRAGTLRANFHQCDITGRLANFDKAAGRAEGASTGYFFNDSDVYKAIEGAAYLLAKTEDAQARAALDRQLDDLIDRIAAAQERDGYINTYFTTKGRDAAGKDPDTRWSNTADKHEMYCIGHLVEAGIAHYAATGKRSLLDAAVQAADHVDSVFGPAPKRPEVPGHEEIEIALIRLWRLGADDPAAGIASPERYLALARHFVETRGASVDGRTLYGQYCQDHLPLRQQEEVVGHAVRAMYLLTAATELQMVEPDGAMGQSLGRLWEDLTKRKMYITGGIGNSRTNEGFTTAYDLPNESAYAETCATIGLAFWAKRMGLLHADARYFDVLERALYNGILSGVSLDGKTFFYTNPLASDGKHHRREWYTCACCPPNVLRFLASLGGSAYAFDDGTVYVNLYMPGTMQISGNGLRISLATSYPWDGKVVLRPDTGVVRGPQRDLALRIPDWCEDWSVSVDGEGVADAKVDRGYVRVPMGRTVELNLDMPVRRVKSHPAVAANVGRAAIQRGPLVYCLEAEDNGAISGLRLPPDANLTSMFRPDLLGGVTMISGQALNPKGERLPITAIPYFAWNNRGAEEMMVWIPEGVNR